MKNRGKVRYRTFQLRLEAVHRAPTVVSVLLPQLLGSFSTRFRPYQHRLSRSRLSTDPHSFGDQGLIYVFSPERCSGEISRAMEVCRHLLDHALFQPRAEQLHLLGLLRATGESALHHLSTCSDASSAQVRRAKLEIKVY